MTVRFFSTKTYCFALESILLSSFVHVIEVSVVDMLQLMVQFLPVTSKTTINVEQQQKILQNRIHCLKFFL